MMKILSKKIIKNTFIHTWWIYLICPIILSILFYFAFNIYHLPSSYEKINIFVGSTLIDDSFKDEIKEDINKDSLKQINISSLSPNQNRFEEKLEVVGLHNCDLLILDKNTIDNMLDIEQYFLIIDEQLSLYHQQGFYLFNNNKYGYDISSSSLFDKYISKEYQYYYLLININSKNIGKYVSEDNIDNDNALLILEKLLKL